MWIYFLTWTLHHIANKKFSDRAYNLLAGSSLYAYLSHYFFIILIAVMIIRPNKISFIPALGIEIVLTNALILVTYLIFTFFYELVVPPKKKEPATLQDRAEEEERALLKQQEITVAADAAKKRE